MRSFPLSAPVCVRSPSPRSSKSILRDFLLFLWYHTGDKKSSKNTISLPSPFCICLSFPSNFFLSLHFYFLSLHIFLSLPSHFSLAYPFFAASISFWSLHFLFPSCFPFFFCDIPLFVVTFLLSLLLYFPFFPALSGTFFVVTFSFLFCLILRLFSLPTTANKTQNIARTATSVFSFAMCCLLMRILTTVHVTAQRTSVSYPCIREKSGYTIKAVMQRIF